MQYVPATQRLLADAKCFALMAGLGFCPLRPGGSLSLAGAA